MWSYGSHVQQEHCKEILRVIEIKLQVQYFQIGFKLTYKLTRSIPYIPKSENFPQTNEAT